MASFHLLKSPFQNSNSDGRYWVLGADEEPTALAQDSPLQSVADGPYPVSERKVFYEYLSTVQERLPKGDIANTLADLNSKVDSDDTLLGYVMGTDTGERFSDFCNFNRWNLIVVR